MRRLVWFRSDLRVADNPALHSACCDEGDVEAIYIDCPEQWREHGNAPIQRDFLERNLQALANELAALGINLHLAVVDSFAQVPDFLAAEARERGIGAIYANREVPINERRRDKAVARALDIPFYAFNGHCTVPPGELQPQSGDMYRVFTPFSRAWLEWVRKNGYTVLPAPGKRGDFSQQQCLELQGDKKNSDNWSAGEAAAHKRLDEFCAEKLLDYGEQRDYPVLDGTSTLSPWLALGVLSVNQCLAAVERELGHLPLSRGESGFCWVNELIWREFYRHLMVVWPRLSMNRAFNEDTEKLRWREDESLFDAWCHGKTGFPIVDAAMRCLKHSGWMHNRLRMVVASFLSKDLQIDWRRGEAWFMANLIDGDLPANNGGWQWAAGTGADAAPYFRVFNPTTQGERFDENGEFIRRWVTELWHVPARYIHQPQDWLQENEPNNDYPDPVVDHAEARKQAVQMFEALKN